MPYAKKTTETLKKLIYILIILPCLTFGQTNNDIVVGTYTCSDARFYYKLDLKNDSSFIYEQSFNLGSTMSNGNWKYRNDTITLFNYETPWKISKVEEKTIDSLKNRILIEIKVNDSNSIKVRGDYVSFYIDGNPTSVKYDYSQGVYKVTDFDVWLNNDCNQKRKTNEKGFVEFSIDSLIKIYIDYNEYKISNEKSNYFIITLSTTPIIFSPPILKWTTWSLNKNKLTPLECGELLKHIKLKR